jgi:hypothetical protein
MRELADKTICGVPLVRRDGVWREEYFTYRFDPPRRPDPSLAGRGPKPNENLNHEPDLTVLDQIYRFELAWRLLRVES